MERDIDILENNEELDEDNIGVIFLEMLDFYGNNFDPKK
jgi:DNA polymerase sigma